MINANIDIKQQDLERVEAVLRLLCGAAEACEAANYAIRAAKELASQIHDPDVRRKVMAAAGKLKADSGNFYG